MRPDRPTTGKLIRKYPTGKTEVLAQDKPFTALQELKKEYIRYGYKKEQLIITY